LLPMQPLHLVQASVVEDGPLCRQFMIEFFLPFPFPLFLFRIGPLGPRGGPPRLGHYGGTFSGWDVQNNHDLFEEKDLTKTRGCQRMSHSCHNDSYVSFGRKECAKRGAPCEKKDKELWERTACRQKGRPWGILGDFFLKRSYLLLFRT